MVKMVDKSTDTMKLENENTKLPHHLILAVGGQRLTEPPKIDSPESWAKYIELAIKSPLIYGTLLTLASMIHSQKWDIKGNKEEELKKLFHESAFEDWKFELFLELLLIGNSFVEFVTPPGGRKLEKLVKIEDPTTIDIKKEGFKYALDEYGQPLAYVQETETETIEIPRERLAHLKLFRWPARVFGVGLVEPVYLYEKARIEVISNITRFAERLNRPLFTIVAKQPISEMGGLSASEIEQIRNELKKLSVSGALFLGAPFEIQNISGTFSSAWVPLLKFLTGEVMVGLGIPQALLFAELRTTPGLVRSQEKLFHERINTIFSRIEEEINRTIIHRIDPNTTFTIERPTPLYLKEVVESLAELARAGMLTPEVVSSMLKGIWSEFPENSMYYPTPETGTTEGGEA